MREGEVINTKLEWEGRTIRLSYTPKWSGVIDHVEIRAEDGDPLPITETSYKSHYFGPVEPALTIDEVAVMVTDWLKNEAESADWKAYLALSRQGNLF